MKKFYDKTVIESCLKRINCETVLRDFKEKLFIVRYEKGEFVTSPLKNEDLFQIVVEGSISIYYIRDDGSIYSLANGESNYLLGDMMLF